MQKICWILSVNRDGATLFVGSPANAGPWLFSNKEQQNIKVFFQPTYEIDFISYDVLSEEVPEAAFILYNECSLPIFPKKSPKLVSRLLMWISLQKIMNSLKKLWLLNLHKNKNSVYNGIRYKRCF